MREQEKLKQPNKPKNAKCANFNGVDTLNKDGLKVQTKRSTQRRRPKKSLKHSFKKFLDRFALFQVLY